MFKRYGYPDAALRKSEHDELRAQAVKPDDRHYEEDKMITTKALNPSIAGYSRTARDRTKLGSFFHKKGIA